LLHTVGVHTYSFPDGRLDVGPKFGDQIESKSLFVWYLWDQRFSGRRSFPDIRQLHIGIDILFNVP